MYFLYAAGTSYLSTQQGNPQQHKDSGATAYRLHKGSYCLDRRLPYEFQGVLMCKEPHCNKAQLNSAEVHRILSLTLACH